MIIPTICAELALASKEELAHYLIKKYKLPISNEKISVSVHTIVQSGEIGYWTLVNVYT